MLIVVFGIPTLKNAVQADVLREGGRGRIVQAGFRLALSNQNNTLTRASPGGGPPIVLQRQ